jgi:hypothetical protein
LVMIHNRCLKQQFDFENYFLKVWLLDYLFYRLEIFVYSRTKSTYWWGYYSWNRASFCWIIKISTFSNSSLFVKEYQSKITYCIHLVWSSLGFNKYRIRQFKSNKICNRRRCCTGFRSIIK